MRAKLQHRPQRPPYKFLQNDESNLKILKVFKEFVIILQLALHSIITKKNFFGEQSYNTVPKRPPYKFLQNDETNSKILKLFLRNHAFFTITQHLYAKIVLQLGLRPLEVYFFYSNEK